MEDAAPNAGVEDAAPNAGVEDADPNAGVEDAAPNAGVEDAAPNAGVEDAAPNAGVEDAAPNAGVEDAAPNAGVEDAAPNAGVEDAAPNAGAEAAAPAADAEDVTPSAAAGSAPACVPKVKAPPGVSGALSSADFVTVPNVPVEVPPKVKGAEVEAGAMSVVAGGAAAPRLGTAVELRVLKVGLGVKLEGVPNVNAGVDVLPELLPLIIPASLPNETGDFVCSVAATDSVSFGFGTAPKVNAGALALRGGVDVAGAEAPKVKGADSAAGASTAFSASSSTVFSTAFSADVEAGTVTPNVNATGVAVETVPAGLSFDAEAVSVTPNVNGEDAWTTGFPISFGISDPTGCPDAEGNPKEKDAAGAAEEAGALT